MIGRTMTAAEIEKLSRLTGTPVEEIRRGIAMGLHPVLTRRSSSGGGAEAREQEEKPA